MSMELFPVAESLSPRLQWMRKHGIQVVHIPKSSAMLEPGEGEPWVAWLGELDTAVSRAMEAADLDEINPKRTRWLCTGATEHDALVNLAELNAWPLWNEE
jgi:hypothetical protein